MDEDIPLHLTQGEEFYKQAQPVDQPQTSPEKDEQFVLRLVTGLKDRRLIDHIRRRLEQDHTLSVTKLRQQSTRSCAFSHCCHSSLRMI